MKKVTMFLTALLLMISLIAQPSISFAKTHNDESLFKSLVENENMKSRILWYDLNANIERLNTPEKIANIVEKTANANFNMIVLDVKGTNGFVAYPSKYSPHISQSKHPRYTSANLSPDFDLIAEVLKEAKMYDLEVHININTFSAGSIPDQEGPSIENKDWQTVVYDVTQTISNQENHTHSIDGFNVTRQTDYLVIYTPDEYEESPANRWGVELVVKDDVVVDVLDRNETDEDAPEIPENGYIVSANGAARNWVLNHFKEGDTLIIDEAKPELKLVSETNRTAAFMNPIHPEVKEYTWDTIREIVEKYDIDGITLDRARYNDIYTDFSDLSRKEFEKAINQEIDNWPEDIFTIEVDEKLEKEIIPGKFYKEWIKWRAQNIEQYFAETRELVKSIKPDVYFNTYVGSWHPLYYSEGVNWASKNYRPDYDWATGDYHETGYADHLDFLMTGLYYPDVYISDLEGTGLEDWYSVEGAANISMEATQYELPTYGALYLLQYYDANDPEGSKEKLKKAIHMAEKNTHGIMIFDLVYLEPEWYDWWDVMEEVFDEKTFSPHAYTKIQELENLLREAKKITNDEGQYTKRSFQHLLDQIELTYNEIKSAKEFETVIDDLQQVIDQLADTTELRKVIAEAEKFLNKEEFTNASYKSLEEAIHQAEMALKNAETKEEVSHVIDALKETIDGVVKVSDLRDLVEEAKGKLKYGKYTETSSDAVKEAIQKAKSVLEEGVTEAEVFQAMKDLEKALSDLEEIKKEPEEDKEKDKEVDKEGPTKPEKDKDTEDVCTGLPGKDEEKDQDQTQDAGKTLPETSTTMYNYLFIGFILIVLGTIGFIIYRNRSMVE